MTFQFPKLVYNWRQVLAKAWSFRLMALAAVFTTAEMVVPMFAANFPPKVFVFLTFTAILGAMITRPFAQANLPVAQVVVVETGEPYADSDGRSKEQ